MSSDKDLEDIRKKKMDHMLKAISKPQFFQPGTVATLTDANFTEAVTSLTKPILVDFWAEWCGPCRMMSPVIEAAAKDYSNNFEFGKLNVDQNPKYAQLYKVSSIPTLIVFKGGQPVDRAVGAIGRNQLDLLLRKHIQK
ncbi:MAG: thioredoxin [Candidatus Bathyarchaeota archaeon]|nr:thioredoxin [Candidatus Bathyarchaeota archaeon]